MGKDLLQSSPCFVRTLQQLEQETQIPLLDLYKDGSRWMDKEYSAIGIVSFQLGLIAVLQQEGGIYPDYFVGHSLGELACAYLAGLASAADVLRCAVVRTQLVSRFMDPLVRLDAWKQREPPPDGYDFILEDYDSVFQQHSNNTSLIGSSKSERLYVKRVPVHVPPDEKTVASFSMEGLMAVVACSVQRLVSNKPAWHATIHRLDKLLAALPTK